jgi:hypothetical protein
LSNQVDHLALCNEHNIPVPDFQATFCIRCLQKECSRSQYGKTQFETRVTTWEERLFKAPLRMDPKDDRYPIISGQKFLPIEASDKGAPVDWLDPKDIPVTKAYSIPSLVEVSPVVPEAPKVESPKTTGLVNTPYRPRQMLEGFTKAPPVSVYDPWKAKAPIQGTVVKPGAKIKLG